MRVAFELSAKGFNTQPPEGGCKRVFVVASARPRFNTQPPEGGCPNPVVG